MKLVSKDTGVGVSKEAVEKSKKSYYDVTLLAIKLPDIEGTKLLIKMRGITPKMGHDSIQNAMEVLNY